MQKQHSRFGGNRAWYTITGELDPFQVSILYTVCADGKVGAITPMDVHAGGTDELMQGHFACGLPSNCLVHSNASGCMDKDGFCGANASNYVFLFIDKHESHFDAEAQLYLEEHHAQVILLRSNNSTEDQPLDMGPNSHIDAIHKDEGSKWRDQRPGLPARSPLSPTTTYSQLPGWDRFVNDPSTKNIVRSAFAKAKLCPVLEDVSTSATERRK